MNRLLNKIHGFVEKIGKRNFILILFVFIVLVITSLYQTFSLYSEYIGMSIVDGIKTYTFILGASNETNTITIAAGEIKYVDITVSNENEADLLYKLYYSSNNDLSDVDVIYLPNTMCLPDGEIKGNNSCVVKLRVKNYSSNNITFDFGVKYGFLSGGDLILNDTEYDIHHNYMKTLFETQYDVTYYKSEEYINNIKNASFVNYIETDTSKMIASWDFSEAEDGSIVAWLENNAESGYYDLYIGSNKKIYAENLNYFFCKLTGLTNINFDNLDTGLTTDMHALFYQCSSLEDIDLNCLDISNVRRFSYVFYECTSLTSLDLSVLDTSSVEDMSCIFGGCSGLISLNLNGIDTSNVTDMHGMFFGCSGLTSLDVSSFNTRNVTNMWFMFDGCSNLVSLDLRNFNTSNVTNMRSMFFECFNLETLYISHFDTSKVETMLSMFGYCYKLTTTITIENSNTLTYITMFKDAATAEGAKITVNYTNETSDLVDNMIATKSTNSNVVKGDCSLGILSVSASGWSGPYDGSAHGITVTSSPSATITYSTTSNGTYSETNPTYTNVGTYTVYYKVQKTNYTTVTGSETVVITKANMLTVPTQKGTLTYTSNAQSPEWNDYNSSQLTLGGSTSETNAGDYSATFTPTSNYQWSDGTTDAKTVTWKIDRATIAPVPSQNGTLTYTRSAQSPTWINYNSSQLTIGGLTRGTKAGNYGATFTPTANYQWSDGTTTAKTVYWKIDRATISTVPSQSGTLTYNGGSLSPSWNNYNSSKLTIGGLTSGTNAGNYGATFTPTANYQWSDGTTTAKTVGWQIQRAIISESEFPSFAGPTCNDGSSTIKSVWNYNSSKLTIGGNTTSSNQPGQTKTVAFTPTANYQWWDLTITAKTATWRVPMMMC